MWPNPQSPADLVTFTEEILKGKLHFLCSVGIMYHTRSLKKCCPDCDDTFFGFVVVVDIVVAKIH